MSGNWTPGPWRVSSAKPTKTRGIDILAGYNKSVASAPAPNDLYRDGVERIANAHLIAAAPDMAYALAACINASTPDERSAAIDKACAALAKARGEA